MQFARVSASFRQGITMLSSTAINRFLVRLNISAYVYIVSGTPAQAAKNSKWHSTKCQGTTLVVPKCNRKTRALAPEGLYPNSAVPFLKHALASRTVAASPTTSPSRRSPDSTPSANPPVNPPSHPADSPTGSPAQAQRCSQCPTLLHSAPSPRPPGCRRSPPSHPALRRPRSSAPATPPDRASWSQNCCRRKCSESRAPGPAPRRCLAPDEPACWSAPPSPRPYPVPPRQPGRATASAPPAPPERLRKRRYSPACAHDSNPENTCMPGPANLRPPPRRPRPQRTCAPAPWPRCR